MENIQSITFGEILKLYRKKRKMTQRQLAEKVGVHYNTIWAWERGDYLPETKGIVLELAKRLALQDYETRQLLESSLISLSLHWNVPFRRNPYFMGRDDVLLQMHHILYPSSEKDCMSAVALSGLGGIGKTQTAIEYAYRHSWDYTSIFWLNAETHEQMRSDLIAIAALLKFPIWQLQDQDKVISELHHWLSRHHGWLLIIDNVQEIMAVKELLPITRHGSLLFTTQRPTLGTLTQTIHLGPMSEEEEIRFLLNRTGRTLMQDPTTSIECAMIAHDTAAVKQIVSDMGGLPLALDQAGAYIEKIQCSFSEFLQLFQKHPLQILDERQAYDEHPLSVAKTFQYTFHQLQQTNSFAAELLILCSMLPLESYPEEFFIEASTHLLPATRNAILLYHQALQDLLSSSLVRHLPGTKSLSIHRLVTLVVRELLAKEDVV